MTRMSRLSRVAVPGGELTVATWDADAAGPPVLAIHGITASTWRGGRSRRCTRDRWWRPTCVAAAAAVTLPGPYGMAAHAADCVAVLDALGIERARSSSDTRWAASSRRSSRTDTRRGSARLVLVDGGAPLPAPATPTSRRLLGPAVAASGHAVRLADGVPGLLATAPGVRRLDPRHRVLCGLRPDRHGAGAAQPGAPGRGPRRTSSTCTPAPRRGPAVRRAAGHDTRSCVPNAACSTSRAACTRTPTATGLDRDDRARHQPLLDPVRRRRREAPWSPHCPEEDIRCVLLATAALLVAAVTGAASHAGARPTPRT